MTIPQSREDTCALTIGTFDGMHRGHMALIEKTLTIAKEQQAHPIIVTFHPHPMALIAPERAPLLLSTLVEKRQLFDLMAIPGLLDMPFTKEFSELRAEEFFLDFETEHGRIVDLIVGHDFTMGHRAHANVAYLENYCAERGIRLHTIHPVGELGATISSTMIRKLIRKGDITSATSLLGHGYLLSGMIVHGDAIGRTLGFPTANFAGELEKCIPEDGVYATYVRIDEKWCFSTTSIGVRPTFQGKQRVVETYCHDLDVNLYDQILTIAFVEKLRDQIHFTDTAMLIPQMRADVENSTRILSGVGVAELFPDVLH